MDLPCLFQYAVTYHVSPSLVFGRQYSQPGWLTSTMGIGAHDTPSALDEYTVVTGSAITVRFGST